MSILYVYVSQGTLMMNEYKSYLIDRIEHLEEKCKQLEAELDQFKQGRTYLVLRQRIHELEQGVVSHECR